jgi:hypothetical protein
VTPKGYVFIYNSSGDGSRGGAVLDVALKNRGWDITTEYRVSGVPWPTVETLKAGGYQFFGIDSSFWGIPTSLLTLAYDAYNAGMNVMTTGNDTYSSSGCPIWTGTFNTGTVNGRLTPTVPNPQSNHPLAYGWTSIPDSDAKMWCTGVRATAKVVAMFTYNSVAIPGQAAIIAEQNPNGNQARFIHAEPYLSSAPAGFWDVVSNWLNEGAAAVIAASGRPTVHVGGAWDRRPAKVYLNGQWGEKPMKRYNGTEWVVI